MSRKASTLQLEHRTGASRCTQRQNRTPKHVRQGIMCRSRRSRPDPSFCGSYARGSRTGFRAQKRIFPASRQPRRTLRDHRRTVLTKICILSTSRLPFRGPAAKLTAPGKSMQAPFLCNFELLVSGTQPKNKIDIKFFQNNVSLVKTNFKKRICT
jgi:hypothetical protein